MKKYFWFIVLLPVLMSTKANASEVQNSISFAGKYNGYLFPFGGLVKGFNLGGASLGVETNFGNESISMVNDFSSVFTKYTALSSYAFSLRAYLGTPIVFIDIGLGFSIVSRFDSKGSNNIASFVPINIGFNIPLSSSANMQIKLGVEIIQVMIYSNIELGFAFKI